MLLGNVEKDDQMILSTFFACTNVNFGICKVLSLVACRWYLPSYVPLSTLRPLLLMAIDLQQNWMEEKELEKKFWTIP